MTTTLHTVRGLVPGKRDRTNLRTLSEAMSFCLDQRAFGPRRLLVAFANRNGRFRGLAYTRRPDPPEAALAGCIEYLGRGAKVAIVFCDEPVAWGPPPDDLATGSASRGRSRRRTASTSWIGSAATTTCFAAAGSRSIPIPIRNGGMWLDTSV